MKPPTNGNSIIKKLFWLITLFCFGIWILPEVSAQTVDLLSPLPPLSEITPGDQTPLPQSVANGLLFPVTFSETTERVYWDIPLATRIPRSATTLLLIVSCTDTTPLRGLSVHLKSGSGWHNASPAFTAGIRRHLALPRGLFQSEGVSGPWEKSSLLRISAWKQTSGVTSITLHAVQARTDTVALISPTERTAPGEQAFAATLVDRCARLLSKAAIPFAVIDDSLDTLDPFTLVLLPYAPTLPDKQLTRLERFVKRNGKLLVFYNASVPLGALLGVRPGSWQGTAPGQEWSAMLICDPPRRSDLPVRVPHVTNSILPPFASADHHARVMATWVDDTGRPTDLPACILSDRGAWFAHIPPLAYPSAVSLLRSLTRTLCPGLEIPEPEPQRLPPDARIPPADPAEIRAVWNPGATARHPRSWNGLLQTLATNGINTVFVHWQRAGTALYERKGSRPADTLTEALAAGAKYGVSVHAWATCWTIDGAASDQITQLTRENRLMRDVSGKTLPWLCPSIPENRALIITGLRSLARRGVQGIHLDYVRYPENTGCYAPATRHAFETGLGSAVEEWPADVLPGGRHAAAFQNYRRETITSFIREARDAVRAVNPSIRLSAAVFPTPEVAASRGQDWPAWLRDGLIDFVCPMIYTESEAAFAASLDACLAAAPAGMLVPGIGTGADESQLDVTTAFLQIGHVRARRLAGFSFFAVDDELMTVLLPSLFLK